MDSLVGYFGKVKRSANCLTITLLSFLLFGCSHTGGNSVPEPPLGPAFQTNIAPADSSKWLAIRVQQNGTNEHFYAFFDLELYNALFIYGQTGWVELNHVYWSTENGRIPAQSEAGERWGYSNSLIIRAESIIRAIPVTEEFVRELTGVHDLDLISSLD